MQCVNCRFENLPGLAACGRCGASLVLKKSVIAVDPPRAAQRSFGRRLSLWVTKRRGGKREVE